MEKQINFNDTMELEKAIISNLIKDNDLIGDTIDVLDVESFRDFKHQELFNSIKDSYMDNNKIDYNTLNHLTSSELTITYIIELGENSPSTARHQEQIKLLSTISTKRKLRETLNNSIKDLNTIKDLDLIMNDIDKTMKNVNINNNLNIEDNNDNISLEIDNILNRDKQPLGIDTKYNKLNDIIYGFQPKEFYVIGARPGQGKSAFALNLTDSIIKQNKNVVFLSLEMSSTLLNYRLMSKETSIPLSKIMVSRDWSDDDIARMKIYAESRKRDNFGALTIIDKNFGTINNIKNTIKRLNRDNLCDVVVVDYLQLIKTNNYKGNRVQEVSHISRTLKEIAMELEMPVIALSQLGRDVANSKPQLHNLRESGQIEQDASVVMLLSTTDPKNKNADVLCDVVKNRNGGLGEVYFNFNRNIQELTEIERPTDLDNIDY